MPPSPIEEILSFAQDKEKESIRFYEDLAKRIDNPVLKETVLSMAGQERKHEKLLRGLNPKNLRLDTGQSLPDIKISNYIVEIQPSKDISYQEILIIAMKREEKSVALYSDLEARAAEAATRKLFALLKGEELRHKATLEKEYEGRVLWEG